MMKKIIAFGLCAVMLLALAGCGGGKKKNEQGVAEYSNKIFDHSYVHEINIEISEDDWKDLRENPLQKTKYEVNITIDGEKLNHVSFATKGNTSLSSVAGMSDSDRYSFKINFGKYEKGQTYYGLDKLNLNNIYADATYMKDYISYEIFRAAGVEAPQTGYVHLSINGESFGLYLAIEEVGDSYLDRTDQEGSDLYKPETEMLGNMDKVDNQPGEGGNFNPDDMGSGNQGNMPPAGMGSGNQGDFNPGNMPGGPQNGDNNLPGNMPGGIPGGGNNFPGNMPGGDNAPGANMGDFIGGMSGGSNGASLEYTDDNPEHYTDIFDNAETEVTDEDKNRLIAALKALSEGKADQALDVEEVINYFVAHNFVLNYDSYTGSMLHNYYLLEKEGKLSVIPWDYNLAFGAFAAAGDSTALINTGIDSPLSGGSEENRPLWAFITSDEKYLQQYHESYKRLMEYANSGELEAEINRVYNMIHSYVERDASAFFTVSEFETAVENLVNFCRLRAESITKQLQGQLATVTDQQKSEDRVSAADVNITAMGSQGNPDKGNMGFPGGNESGSSEFPQNKK